MRKRKLLFVTVLCLIIGMSFASSAGARMLKEVAMGVFDNAPSQAEADWFYMRYHGPEITRLSGPWMSRYQLWLPYEPPGEAIELFGAVRGRYAELWYREADYLDRPEMSGITPPPFNATSTKKSGQTNAMVPANPTDVFYDTDPHPEETSILRWVTFVRYPDGVSVADGEKWFLDVYAKEAATQPGLLKFVSHKVVDFGDEKVPGTDVPAGMPAMKKWVRICEYWYRDFEAWRKAVLDEPPGYTVPSWGSAYPFMEMASTFIPYYSDVDFLKGTYSPDYTRPEATFSMP